MKKVSALLLLVAYLGFIASVFVSTHEDFQVCRCDEPAKNLLAYPAPGESSDCYSDGFLHQNYHHHYPSHKSAFAKLKVPVSALSFFHASVSTFHGLASRPASTQPSALAKHALYIRHGVLLI